MNLLQHKAGRLTLFGLLYLSEGAPIGLIWWAMPTYLRTQGLPIEKITGLTSSLVLLWALKFLWAPMIDRWRTPRFGYREWIFTAQFAMGLTLLPLLKTNPAEDFVWFATFLGAHSFCATVQDVAIDAFAMQQPSRDRGILNGSMQTGMLVGRSIFGGGALLASTVWGWPVVFAALIASIWLSMIALVFVVQTQHNDDTGGREAFLPALQKAFTRRETRVALLFALTSAAAFEAAGALAGPFLIDRGASQDAVGWFYGIPVVVCTVAGGIFGGLISDRGARTRSVRAFLLGFVVIIVALAIVDSTGLALEASYINMSLLAAMYLFVGLFIAASYALYMDATDHRVAATQFSAFMSATNACEAWSGWAGGRMTASFGYSTAFVAMSVVSLLSLFLLRGFRSGHLASHEPADSAR